MKEIENYDSKEAEERIRKFWEKEKIFKFDDNNKDIFSIDTPPPTVSGSMHIGHAFSYSQIDFIARYQRMKGKNVLMPFGTDDNGLPTERLVEKMNDVKSSKMNREEFIELCISTLNKIRPKFIEDWKRIGLSADWDLYYSTIDDSVRKISQKAIIDLYKKGLLYRKEAPFIWCPLCQTAISQVEMKDMDLKSQLNYIKSKLIDSENTYLIYATTRPELLFGCVGMSVESEGSYVKLKVGNEIWITGSNTYKDKFGGYEVIETIKGSDIIGKKCKIPISDMIIEIDDDESVSADYGTGIVYYCTYGGNDCVEWMTRHPKIEPIELINKDGTMNQSNQKYQGMKINDARNEIIKDLEPFLVKIEKINHMVNVHERCETEIEILITKQWFIKYLDKKEEFLKSGNEMNWNPNHMKSRYDNWVEGLKWDWCISRQRYFGVPFPVWYNKKTDEPIFAEDSELPVDPIRQLPSKIPENISKDDIVSEKDVLDTWVTSSLTPKIIDSLVESNVYPMSLRPQAHDIISFWLFNTVVRSRLHDNKNPWNDIMISGWALDPKGRKMSKSKGNVIEPQKVIEKYSADAMRFWAADSKLGDDLPYQEKDLITGTKTIRKLWNAYKFMSKIKNPVKPKEFSEMDKWMLSKLSSVVKECTEAFEIYHYHTAKQKVENLFWNIFADYYIEISKDRIYNPDSYEEYEVDSAKYTLYTSMLQIIKLFSPIMPFITEEIYKNHFSNDAISIHKSKWPSINYEFDQSLGDDMIKIISALRKYKSENNMSMNSEINSISINKDVKEIFPDIKSTMKIKEIKFEDFDDGIEISDSFKIKINS